jgi:hypothetical protein
VRQRDAGNTHLANIGTLEMTKLKTSTYHNGSILMRLAMIQRHDGIPNLDAQNHSQSRIADTTRDFFVRHSDDDAREARYLHRTWRKSDGGFYVGIDPPERAKPEGIVRVFQAPDLQFADYASTILALELWEAVPCTMDVSRLDCPRVTVSDSTRLDNGPK